MLKTQRTQVRRNPKRGRHDRDTIDAILDEALIAHVAWVHDGRPAVIPTLIARDGDDVLIHGSSASRALRGLQHGLEACIEVTLIDGLVLARSAFHHSINYRSVVVLGHAVEEHDPDAKAAALEAFVDHIMAGRAADSRRPTAKEVRKTTVLRLPLREASAKIRTGPPVDDPEDLALPVWGGVVPLSLHAGTPEPDGAATIADPVALPAYVRANTRARQRGGRIEC
jgi:hypothetical protein